MKGKYRCPDPRWGSGAGNGSGGRGGGGGDSRMATDKKRAQTRNDAALHVAAIYTLHRHVYHT